VKRNCCEEFLEQTDNKNEWLIRNKDKLLELRKEMADIRSKYS
jgi:hypothetical protein